MAGHIEIAELLDDAGWIRSLAASLIGDGAQADDLVQDTWLAALRRPPRAAGEARPWLARVVRNLARNARRERVRREAREELAHEERALPSPDALAQQAEAQRLLAEAVTRLAEPLRDAIVLRYFQGLDSGAAAARLGVPASTLRTRLQRALEELRADLDRRAKGGREGWGLLLAPLVHRASGAPSHAPLPAAGAAAPGALAPALLVGAGAVCALTAAGTIYWRLARDPGAVEVVTAAAPLAAVEPEPQASEARSAGERHPLDPLPASATAAGSDGAGAAAAALAAQPGTELSGTILVDGRAPEWPIELTLEPHVPPVEPGDKTPRRRMRRDVLEIEPEQRGRFTFGELPPSWSGRLVVSDFAFANGESSLSIDAPRSDLVLALHSGPAILGRIFDTAGRPAGGVEGRYRLWLGRSGGAETDVTVRTFRCRADGRFRIGSDGAWQRAALTILIEDEGVGYLHLQTPEFVPAEAWDLGDLQLEPVRALAFTVHDALGAPIEGAFARVQGPAWSRRSTSTGPDGRGSLPFVPERAVEVRVSAAGFEDRVQPVPEQAALEAVLAPLAALDLRLVGSLATQADKVLLSAERAAFVWDASGWDERADLQAELGSIKPSLRRSPAAAGQRFEYEFQRQHDGCFHLVGLVPDVPISVEVLDEHGSLLAADSVSVASQASAKLELGDPNTPGPEPIRTKVPMRRSAALPR
jgi:RNA polymerase sigma-70 factor (ECF subfamily)